jgi:uncharacterized protein (UPF0332 family)
MMSLRKWLSEQRLRKHQSSPEEIRDLMLVVERDFADAAIESLSADRRFATSYNAVLQLATAVLRASGYRTAGGGHHWITFQALPHVMGDSEQDRADYFDSCRRKRNIADYDAAGEIADSEVQELYDEANAFRRTVQNWLCSNHPDLVPTE